LGQRPERRGVTTQTTYLSLTKRRAHCCTRFGAFRPYLIPCNPAQTLLDPGIKKTFEAQGIQTEGPTTPIAFKTFTMSEIAKYQKMIKSLDIKSE
jgi:hypothetical protein